MCVNVFRIKKPWMSILIIDSSLCQALKQEVFKLLSPSQDAQMFNYISLILENEKQRIYLETK